MRRVFRTILLLSLATWLTVAVLSIATRYHRASWGANPDTFYFGVRAGNVQYFAEQQPRVEGERFGKPRMWRLAHAVAVVSPSLDRPNRVVDVFVPLSLIACVTFPAPIVWVIVRLTLWRRNRAVARRVAAGGCPSCLYDLRGNVSGVCPECGAAVPSPHAPPSGAGAV